MENTMEATRPLVASLKVKNGRYYAAFRYVDITGQTHEAWKTLRLEAKAGNKRIAQRKMEEMKCNLRGIIDVPGYAIPFTEYIRTWLENRRGEVEENTFDAMQGYVEHKIVPFFEKKRLALSEVKAKHIKDFYEHLYRNGREDGKGGLSISTIKSIKSILNKAFKDAVVEELVFSNPVEVVKLPAKDNPRKKHTVLDKKSANRLLGNVIEDPLMFPLLLLVLRYGLRKSEALGLKWKAIDYENEVVRIESVVVSGRNPEKDRTKTETSRGTFRLFPEIIEALKIRREDQIRQCENRGEPYVEPTYVFTRPDGKHLSPSWVTKKFKQIIAASGLPDMTFHELRHSAACILLEVGTRFKEIQQWMRHGKRQITADVYLHVSKEREKELTESLCDMFAPPSNDSKKIIFPMDA